MAEEQVDLPAPPLHIYGIATPQTATIHFDKIFKNVDEQTSITFKKISESRNEVVIASERSFAEAAVKGVQKYLPCLFGLMEAADKLPSDFTKNLQITWSSALGRYYLTSQASSTNWYFEVTMVLTTYGILFRRLAKEKLHLLMEDRFDDGYTDIVKDLSTAAGVFQYIHQNVSTKFFVKPAELPIPEIFAELYTILANISLAEAQTVVIKRAIRRDTKPSTLARLCAGVANLLNQSLVLLKNLEEQAPHKKFLVLSFKLYLEATKTLYESLAYSYMGRSMHDEAKPGHAIGYLRKACSVLKTDVLETTKRDCEPDMQQQYDKLKRHHQSIKELLAVYEDDNQRIYHEFIREDEVYYPESKLIVSPVKFEVPAAQEIAITRKEGGLCLIQ
jgi:hypothetical protein